MAREPVASGELRREDLSDRQGHGVSEAAHGGSGARGMRVVTAQQPVALHHIPGAVSRHLESCGRLPREILKLALQHNAVAIMMASSGTPTRRTALAWHVWGTIPKGA